MIREEGKGINGNGKNTLKINQEKNLDVEKGIAINVCCVQFLSLTFLVHSANINRPILCLVAMLGDIRDRLCYNSFVLMP